MKKSFLFLAFVLFQVIGLSSYAQSSGPFSYECYITKTLGSATGFAQVSETHDHNIHNLICRDAGTTRGVWATVPATDNIAGTSLVISRDIETYVLNQIALNHKTGDYTFPGTDVTVKWKGSNQYNYKMRISRP